MVKKQLNKESLGYNKDDIANSKDMEKYYSIEEQNKYGVLGIEIKLNDFNCQRFKKLKRENLII